MSRRHSDGFTLLEVMIALAILALSLTVLSESQTNAVRAVGRAKAMTIATQLARHKMVDLEDELFEEGFSDFEQEDKGDFADEGFKDFGWVVKVDKIELPASINPESLTSALTGGGDDADSSGDSSAGGGATGGMFALGAKMMSAQFEIFRNVLEQSIRRVSVRVTWKEGSRERYISVVGYFTDPRKVEAVTGGGLPTGIGTTGTGTTGTGTTGTGTTGTGATGTGTTGTGTRSGTGTTSPRTPAVPPTGG